MKYALIIFSFILIYGNTLKAQPRLLQEYQYLEKNDFFYQQLSMIGLYDSALYYEDKLEPPKKKSSISIHDTFKVVSLFEDSMAEKFLDTNQIVILNEAHHLPQTRTTLYALLDMLKKHHYLDVFFEGLNQNNVSYLKNHPPTFEDGFYVQEIVFAEILRKLKKLKTKERQIKPMLSALAKPCLKALLKVYHNSNLF